MNRSRTLLALVLALPLAACATGGRGSTADMASPPTDPRAAGLQPCLPPGVSRDFLAWPVQDFRRMMFRRDDDTVAPGAWVLYAKGEARVVAVWSGDDLVAVDPSPTTDTPVWIDTAVLDERAGAIRAQAATSCRWRLHGQAYVRLAPGARPVR